jgi:hypothetical protein
MFVDFKAHVDTFGSLEAAVRSTIANVGEWTASPGVHIRPQNVEALRDTSSGRNSESAECLEEIALHFRVFAPYLRHYVHYASGNADALFVLQVPFCGA